MQWICRILAGTGLALLVGVCAANSPSGRDMAWYYGTAPIPSELRLFDQVIVQPRMGHDPKQHDARPAELIAYVSVGEVEAADPLAADIPESWFVARNDAWKSRVVDQSRSEWRAFLLDRVLAPLWERGYRGFFLDTLDSWQLLGLEGAARDAQIEGLVTTVTAIHERFPGVTLVLNRGFEILPKVHSSISAVVAESLYQGFDPTRGYVAVNESDRAWLIKRLDEVRAQWGKPVYVLDYLPPQRRQEVGPVAGRIRAHGFIPYVTDGLQLGIGVGAVEPIPRRVLLLYSRTEAEDLADTEAHQLLTLPLEYLGLVPDYVEINDLPERLTSGRYAGIVVSLWKDAVSEHPGLAEWLEARRSEGHRLAFVGGLGGSAGGSLPRALGVEDTGEELGVPYRVLHAGAGVGFEAAPVTAGVPVPVIHAPRGTPWLTLGDGGGRRSDVIAVTPWGGYALNGQAFREVPGRGNRVERRWVVDPVEFFRSALGLQEMPAPDVTTENGRRLLMVHVDGDGFASRAELPGTPFAGEALARDIISQYRVPTSLSVIEGEIAPWGLYPQHSERLEAVARDMLAQSHVEAATHTYSHPFVWADASKVPESARAAMGSSPGPRGTDAASADLADHAWRLDLPGYRFDLEREIAGSARYVSERLLPPGRSTALVFWSGDCRPGEKAIGIARLSGLASLNGGGGSVTRSNSTLAGFWPLGIARGAEYQVYAPGSNENDYTRLWTGPFHGYERAIETFEISGQPRRLKPIDIYYHTYSASKQASLQALKRVYDWALAQPVYPVFASEYVRKVLDFRSLAIGRTESGIRVRGDGSLRTIRLPKHWGPPDLLASSGVAGSIPSRSGRYVHLAGGASEVSFSRKSPEGGAAHRASPGAAGGFIPPKKSPWLLEANGRMTKFATTASGIAFGLEAHVPLVFTVGGARGCRITVGERPVVGESRSDGAVSIRLNALRAEHIKVACRG